MKFLQKMRLYFFYTMVQKSQKWPKTQIKGGPALSNFAPSFSKIFLILGFSLQGVARIERLHTH